MKHTFTGLMITMVLVLALLIGAVALAENAGSDAPATEQAPAQTQAPAEDAASDTAALQDALKAYEEARASSRQEDLEAELKGYVESGKLTQEQADLILKHYKDRQALQGGVCPNCGYQFQGGQGKGGQGKGGQGKGGQGKGGQGKGGRMNSGKGNRVGGGFGGKGGRGMMGMNGMNGQQPSQGQDASGADGMAFGSSAQALPDLTGDDSI